MLDRILLGRTRRARAALVAAIASAVLAAACSDFLRVENPGAVEADDLNSPEYVTLMQNGVISQFQLVSSWMNYYGAIFTDELSNTHVFFEEGLFDQRNVAPENGTYSFFLYGRLHQARFVADSFASRMQTILADSANRDLRLARVKAYGGLNYILLGENLCESPINVSAPLPPDELFGRAVERFDDAIAIATAARAVPTATPATIAGADSVIALANVGAARALLNMGQNAEAVTYASTVDPAFEFWSYFSDNSAAENNIFWGRLSTGAPGSNSATITYTPFLAYDGDPRVPRPATEERGMNADSVYLPNSPLSFSTHDGTATGADFTQQSDIIIASGLEAQYIVAEAEGLTPTNLDFVNDRRAIGGMLPLTAPTADEYMAALREQRGLDLYLSGHRMGDLRRYIRFHGVDLFPSGPYPNTTTGVTYGDQTCWPLNLAEINGNPNV